MTVVTALYGPVEFAAVIPGEFVTPLTLESQGETVMTVLARIALVALILVSAGCSSMGMGDSSSAHGDMTHSTSDSHYGGSSY